MPPKTLVIGAGFSGLSAASHLARAGQEVHVLEKHDMAGGRARVWREQGFTWDMGPSWYWMPDVFERFFGQFGKSVSDYYDLVRLDPSYRVWFGPQDAVDVPASESELAALFDQWEPGSGAKLKRFLDEAEFKYNAGMRDLVYKPGLRMTEFMNRRVLGGLFRLHLLGSFARHIRKSFRHPRILQLLEFPVLFLGAKPAATPALYSLMNYADVRLGTWYPMGGMYRIVEAMEALAREQGVQFHFNQEVKQILTVSGRVTGVKTANHEYSADAVIASADYHHAEQLLGQSERQYTEAYWQKRTFAPSCLIYYLGVNKKLPALRHHNLFFDTDFGLHAREIYDSPQWPSQPLFYVSAPSVTDASVAPEGCENLFLLIPVATGLTDTPEVRERYLNLLLDRIEQLTGERIRGHIVAQRSYAPTDFVNDYHACRGNAYGLANTLRQTAFLKPKMQSQRLPNLWFAGQLTTPGPGVPPALISGEVAASLVIQNLQSVPL